MLDVSERRIKSFCFVDEMCESGLWDWSTFWSMDAELCRVALSASEQAAVDKSLVLELIIYQGKILNAIAAHYDSNDQFEIRLISEEELLQVRERLAWRFRLAIEGGTISEDLFEMQNPHLIA